MVHKTHNVASLHIPVTFATEVGQALNGVANPDHWFDFINNRAIFAGVDVGTISDIPGRSGTLDMSASGQLVDAAGDAQTITSPGLNQTYTMFIEFARASDTGALVRVGGTYTTTEADRAVINVAANDNHQATTTISSVTGYNSAAVANTAGTTYKSALRVALNDTRACTNGTLHAASGAVSLPATPDTIKLGATQAGGSVFTGYIRKVAFFNSALTDAQLQAMTV